MSKRKRNPTAKLDYAGTATRSPAREVLVTRWWIVLSAMVLFLFVFFAYAGDRAGVAFYRLLTDGVALLIWLVAMIGAGIWILKAWDRCV